MLSLTWTRANTVQCYIYKVKNSKLQKLKLKRKLSGNKIWRKLDYICMFFLNFVYQNIRILLHLYFTNAILQLSYRIITSFSVHSFIIFKIKTIITSSFSLYIGNWSLWLIIILPPSFYSTSLWQVLLFVTIFEVCFLEHPRI